MEPTDPPSGAPAVSASRRLSPRLLVALALAGAVMATELGAIRNLLRLWDTSPMYSYGYLVPAISLFLAYATRDRYLGRPVRPAPVAGGLVFAAWAGLLLLGRVSGIILLEQIALVVAAAGIVLVVWGLARLRAVWFAVAYLLLMVPIWDVFTEPMHLRFQLFSAGIGLRVLDLLGIPAFREGTFISLPNLTLEVARACSGVNYLVAVLALALPLAHLYLRTTWKRVVLVLSGIVIAALSNGLRVALIGVLAYADIGAPLHGPGHVLHGLFVSGIGLAMLLVSLSILQETPAGPAGAPAAPLREATPPARLHAALAALAFIVFTAAGLHASRPAPVPLRVALDGLPLQIGPWVAVPFAEPAHPGWWENADAELRRRYVDGGRAIDVFVVYFAAQEQEREAVGVRTDRLHRAAREVALSKAPGAALANVSTTDDAARPVVFWYEIDGRVEADAYAAKLQTMWRALTRRRTNAAAVFLRAAPGREPVPIEAMTAFGAALHESLAVCLPRPTGALLAEAGPGANAP
jgi:EpsI family protein